MSELQLAAGLEAFRAEARKLADKAFREKAAHWDEREVFPAENRDLLARLGYLGMVIPGRYGGAGAPVIQGAAFLEEIARVRFNTALVCQLALNGPTRAIAVLGTEKQKWRWLPKCASGVRSRARLLGAAAPVRPPDFRVPGHPVEDRRHGYADSRRPPDGLSRRHQPQGRVSRSTGGSDGEALRQRDGAAGRERGAADSWASGFTRELPLERMLRDARGFALGGGATEILRNTIAAMVYGRVSISAAADRTRRIDNEISSFAAERTCPSNRSGSSCSARPASSRLV